MNVFVWAGEDTIAETIIHNNSEDEDVASIEHIHVRETIVSTEHTSEFSPKIVIKDISRLPTGSCQSEDIYSIAPELHL